MNRYEWRHNSVLRTLMNNFVTIASKGFRLYADINGYACPSRWLRSSRPQDPDADKYRPRPDTAIQERNKTTIFELTFPFETKLNFKKNFMAPFYGWGSTASRLEPLRRGSLLFTTKFPEVPGTHFIDLGRMKG